MLRLINRYAGLALAVTLLGIMSSLSCGGSSSNYGTNPSPPPPPPSPTHSAHFHAASIQNFAFSPSSLSISVGDTVLWTNNDSALHTVTSDTGSELNGQLSPGLTYQHIFMAAGSFPYHCNIHPSMHGSVTVQ